jgi:hypothetical protein
VGRGLGSPLPTSEQLAQQRAAAEEEERKVAERIILEAAERARQEKLAADMAAEVRFLSSPAALGAW